MSREKLKVIYEDNHLLVVSKPAGVATMGIEDQSASLLGIAKQYIAEKYNKPGNVYLGVVSRIDSLVSGVIVFARTSKAAARLNDQFKNATVEKTYWAVVENCVVESNGQLTDWVAKNESMHKMEIVSEHHSSAKKAILNFETIDAAQSHTVLQVQLETGRKHQIRVQLAAIGHPIIGDKKYGSSRNFSYGIALHSKSLSLIHPTKKERLTFQTLPPKSWERFGISTEN